MQNGLLAHRGATITASLALVSPLFAAWSEVIAHPVTETLSMIVLAWLLACLMLALTASTSRHLRRIDYALLAIALVILGLVSFTQVSLQPQYGSDEAAIVQGAAQLVLDHRNPYTRHFAFALSQFQVPQTLRTYTANNVLSDALPYPALPLWLVIPAILLTNGTQSAIITTVVALMIATIFLFIILPSTYRSIALVYMVAVPILPGFAAAGMVGVELLVPLTIVAWRWVNIGASDHLTRADLLRAVALGFAISTQQLAWFLAPFVVLGIWRLRHSDYGWVRATSLVSQWVGVSLVTVFALNSPFIILSPLAWIKGILSPLTQHALPYGQGLVGATVYLGLGGGRLDSYTYGALALYAALCVLWFVAFRRLGPGTFILPIVALFVAPRSLTEYFVLLGPAWLVALSTCPPQAYRSVRDVPGPWKILWPLYFVPAIYFIAIALTSTSPLDIKIIGTQNDVRTGRVWAMEISATNRSSRTRDPYFSVTWNGLVVPWMTTSGPSHLAPGMNGRYRLVAPASASMPPIGAPILAEGSTSSPETLSISRPYANRPRVSCVIIPSAAHALYPSGSTQRLTVQLQSALGGRMYRSGAKIALGQSAYGAADPLGSTARIDGAPSGRTPVYGYTNREGVVQFTVSNSEEPGVPVSFQAAVVRSNGAIAQCASPYLMVWGG